MPTHADVLLELDLADADVSDRKDDPRLPCWVARLDQLFSAGGTVSPFPPLAAGTTNICHLVPETIGCGACDFLLMRTRASPPSPRYGFVPDRGLNVSVPRLLWLRWLYKAPGGCKASCAAIGAVGVTVGGMHDQLPLGDLRAARGAQEFAHSAFTACIRFPIHRMQGTAMLFPSALYLGPSAAMPLR